MASLKFLLGLIPATAKIEQAEKALVAEFDKLKAFAESDTLKKFNELKDLINSSDFRDKKKEIESLVYKNSEEYMKEKVDNAEEIKVVGIIKQKEGSISTQTAGEIGYLKTLKEHVINKKRKINVYFLITGFITPGLFQRLLLLNGLSVF